MESVANVEKPDEESPAESADGQKPATLKLTLGDFLPRISADILRQDKHDPLLTVEIPLTQLAQSLAQGRTAVPLVEVFRGRTDLFVDGILEGAPIEIIYPWRRIVQVLTETNEAGNFGPALLTALAESRSEARSALAASARPSPVSREILKGRKSQNGQVSWFSAQGAGNTSTTPTAPSTVPPISAPVMSAKLISVPANVSECVAPEGAPDLVLPGIVLEPLGARGSGATDRTSASAETASLAPAEEAKLPDISIELPAVAAKLEEAHEFRESEVPPSPAELGRELARIQGERDSIRAHLDEHSAVAARDRADLQREHESMIATLLAEHEETLKSLRAAHERDLAEKDALLEWNARTINSLEADVETYRQRIKVVLLERDALRAEAQALSQPATILQRDAERGNETVDEVADEVNCCSASEGPNCAGCVEKFALAERSAMEGVADVDR